MRITFPLEWLRDDVHQVLNGPNNSTSANLLGTTSSLGILTANAYFFFFFSLQNFNWMIYPHYHLWKKILFH